MALERPRMVLLSPEVPASSGHAVPTQGYEHRFPFIAAGPALLTDAAAVSSLPVLRQKQESHNSQQHSGVVISELGWQRIT